jgi:hypothetical protein
MNTDPTTGALDAGIAQANAADGGVAEQEMADVKKWQKRIKEGREFDKLARKRYAIDRQFARGDKGGFRVALPIAATYVDILKSFLYAKDPDLDCQPPTARRRRRWPTFCAWRANRLRLIRTRNPRWRPHRKARCNRRSSNRRRRLSAPFSPRSPAPSLALALRVRPLPPHRPSIRRPPAKRAHRPRSNSS